MTESLAVVAAVNDRAILQANLAASPLLKKGDIGLIVEQGHKSAGAAYNAGMGRANADIVIFAHQDVYLPLGWERHLLGGIEKLKSRGCKWGVLGVYGIERTGEYAGRVWSSGLGRELGKHFDEPQEVVSIDELVIILLRASQVFFDMELPGFHLYGTDIVQTAVGRGLGAYVIHAPVIHNSKPVISLGKSYWLAYRYTQKKWARALPIPTCIMPITPTNWQRWRYKISIIREKIRRAKQKTGRYDNPKEIAQRLGYEPFRCVASIGKELPE